MLLLAVATSLTLAVAPPAHGQGAPWLPRLQLDNDAYDFWLDPASRTDEQYTNGVVFSLESWRAPWWGHRFAPHSQACADTLARDGACLATVVAIAQDIYTPNLRRPPFSEPNWQEERPYAAWLRVSGTARIISARALREVEIAAGVTGPPALGQVAQSIAHALARPYTVTATGWETGVGFEPGILAAIRQSWLAARSSLLPNIAYDVTPYAFATLGNILTAAAVGTHIRLGYNLSHPWDPRAWQGRPTFEGFIASGAERDYVREDFSLDGVAVGGGRRVQRVPGVTQYEFGAGVRYDRLSLSYRAVTRTREYATGPAQHSIGSMVMTIDGR